MGATQRYILHYFTFRAPRLDSRIRTYDSINTNNLSGCSLSPLWAYLMFPYSP